MPRSQKIILFIALILTALLLAVVNHDKNFTPITPSLDLPTMDTSKWLTYQNDKYGFSIKYPPTWDVKELYNPFATNTLAFYAFSFVPEDFATSIEVQNYNLDIYKTIEKESYSYIFIKDKLMFVFRGDIKTTPEIPGMLKSFSLK